MQPTTHNRIASLDGLRGLASLLVLAWHFNLTIHHYLPVWVGMDIFFALSGYWITQRLLTTRGEPGYLSRFYFNRLVRIVPLYYAFLIIFFLFIHFISARNRPLFEYYLVHWKSFFLFTENWTFIRYGWPKDFSLVPTWSVAVETQFYVLWPAVILLSRSARFRLIAFPILIALIWSARILVYYYYPPWAGMIYYNSLFKLDNFIIGSLVCQWQLSGIKPDRRLLGWITAALVTISTAVSVITHNAAFENPFFPLAGYTLQNLLAGCMLIYALESRTRASFFQHNFLQYCGRISYCLYLIHMPILIALTPRFATLGDRWWPGHHQLFFEAGAITALVLSFGISTLSYHYFESYFLRLKK
jgi:peptidoglycan/LPS O-acetylase OafA/YrhL